MVPLRAALPKADRRTVRGAAPEAGVALATAVGGTPTTDVVRTATTALVVLLPLLSVVRTVALKVPAAPYT